MSAQNSGSGPRSNSYSENKLTHWAEYEPWWLEIQATLKRFDGKIAKNPSFPKIIEFAPSQGFIRPCNTREVEAQLLTCAEEFLKRLRAVFILPGTSKQFTSRNRSRVFYGHYWRSCVFLHAYPFGSSDLNGLRRFYIRDVLMHEIGHHVDTLNTTKKDREHFAEKFAQTHG